MRLPSSFREGGSIGDFLLLKILVVWRRLTADQHKNSLQSCQSTKACQRLRPISVVPTGENFLFSLGKRVDELLTNVPILQEPPKRD